ncbi:hypothetical protein EDD85DRAFT_794679 [Armillaria nabsnona]|nr:hypothetical protein EDD85DRAFT_794679 [Armillaria nabsnona]
MGTNNNFPLLTMPTTQHGKAHWWCRTRYDYVRVQMCSSSSEVHEPNTHAIISSIMLGTFARKDRLRQDGVKNATHERRGKHNGLGDITKCARQNHQVLEPVDAQQYNECTVLETNVSDVLKHLHQELNALDIEFSILKDETLWKNLQERMLKEKHRQFGRWIVECRWNIMQITGSDGRSTMAQKSTILSRSFCGMTWRCVSSSIRLLHMGLTSSCIRSEGEEIAELE